MFNVCCNFAREDVDVLVVFAAERIECRRAKTPTWKTTGSGFSFAVGMINRWCSKRGQRTLVLSPWDQRNCRRRSAEFSLAAGMYFSLPGGGTIGTGQGFVVSQSAYEGFFQIGGPVESRGRLRYIDGCSDSLLIAPIVSGDACLNLLHVPPGTNQSAHTHPSFRVGMVLCGSGECRTEQGVQPLQANAGFVIPADSLHSFHTNDDELLIVAFHPDSDWGPTDDLHPMLNRTYIEGVSASADVESQTRTSEQHQQGTRS